MLDNKIGLTTIILVATISIAFISVLSPVDGESYEAGGVTYSYTSDSNEAIVVSYDGSVSDVCILSVFTAGDVEYNVVEIADSAFEGSISLKSVSIPVSVKTIGNAAFKDCVSLENAVIIVSDDDAYASRIIGKSAFENCTSLKSVSSHPSLTPGIASFKNCGLESVTVYLRSFSKSGYISSSELFMNCTQLSSVDIVKGDANFYGFSGDSIFEGCTSLKSVPIPDVAKLRFMGMIGSRVFMNSGIENVVVESASASINGIIVGANSFDGCKSLKTFIINTKVDFSGAGLTGHPTTFGGCVIEKMELAEWQSTDFRAFDGCTIDFLKLGNVQYLSAVPEDCIDRITIRHIDLGGALSTSLSDDVKNDEKMSTVATIPGLESITMTGENTKYGMVGSGVYRLDYYNAEAPTNPVALIISSPDAVAIDIPSTVTSVGADAFTNCRNLTRVSFPEGLTTFAYAGNDVSFVDSDGMPVGTDVENFAGCTYVGSDGVLVLQTIEVGTSFTVDGVEYTLTSLDPAQCSVTGYEPGLKDLVVPKTVEYAGKDYNVVAIADSAFEGSDSLKTVTIPVSVVTIGTSAFKGCSALEYATIEVSDTGEKKSRTIGASAFENCASLKQVTSHPTITLGNACFKNSGLEYYKIYMEAFDDGWGNGFVDANELFMNCSRLAKVDVDYANYEAVYLFGTAMFSGCSSLKNFPFPTAEDPVKYFYFFGAETFKNSGIESVHFSCTTGVSAEAFDGCTALKSVICDCVTTFGGPDMNKTTFSGCNIDEFVIAVQSLQFKLFSGCNVNSLILTDVQYINSILEEYSTTFSIKNIDLGGLLSTSLSDDSKNDSSMAYVAAIPGLEKITMTGENTKYGMVGSGVYRLDYYNAEAPTNPVALIITSPDAVALDIPATVTSVGADAFTNCGNLTRVSFPEGLTTFAYAGEDVSFVDADGMPVGTDVENFAGCTYAGSDGVLVLQTIEVGTSFTVDGVEYTLTSLDPAQCSVTGYEPGLKDLVVPKTVEYAGKDYRVLTIGARAFYKCKTIETADLGSVTSIGASAFNYCSYLKSVDFGDSLKTIGSYAFNKCFYLKNADLTDSAASLKTIGAYAFNKCSKISVLAISGNVQKIYSTAFTVPFADADGNALAVSADELKGYLYKNVKGTFVQQEAVAAGTEFDDGVLIYSVKTYLPCTAEVIGYTGTIKYLAIPESVQFNDLDYKVTEIAPKAFFKCKTLLTADLGSVKKVGSEAFSVCSNLKSVTMTSVTDIEAKAFAYCPKLVTVEFGDQLSIIRASAFFKCYKLAELDLPDSLKTIRNSAFSECKLEKVSFGTGLKTVTSTSFAGTVFMDGDAVVSPTAANLAGSVFAGSDGVLILQRY